MSGEYSAEDPKKKRFEHDWQNALSEANPEFTGSYISMGKGPAITIDDKKSQLENTCEENTRVEVLVTEDKSNLAVNLNGEFRKDMDAGKKKRITDPDEPDHARDITFR